MKTAPDTSVPEKAGAKPKAGAKAGAKTESNRVAPAWKATVQAADALTKDANERAEVAEKALGIALQKAGEDMATITRLRSERADLEDSRRDYYKDFNAFANAAVAMAENTKKGSGALVQTLLPHYILNGVAYGSPPAPKRKVKRKRGVEEEASQSPS